MKENAKHKKKVVLDEYNEPVTRTRRGKITRVVVILLVVLINLFLILRAISSCDVALADQMLLSATLRKNLASAALYLPAPQGFSSYTTRDDFASGVRVARLTNTSAAQNASDEMGHLQVKNVAYFDGAGNLQLTMKQNTRHYPLYNENGHPLLSYLVRVIDRDGNTTYCNTTLSRSVSEERGGYAYTRVSFDNLPIELSVDYVTLYVFLTDETDQTILAVTISSAETALFYKELSSLHFLAV